MVMYELVFWLMLGVFALAMIYPWHPTWPGAKWLVHMPLLLFPLWFWYEAVMPRHMNIRLDLPLILLGVSAACMLYVVRIVLFVVLTRMARGDTVKR